MCLFSPLSYAASDWAFQDVFIEDILIYSANGQNVVTVKMEGAGVVDTNCGPTDQHRIVSYWVSDDFSSIAQGWVSLLLSAQAQSLPVNLFVDMDSCETSTGWYDFGNPTGLGLQFLGVQVKND